MAGEIHKNTGHLHIPINDVRRGNGKNDQVVGEFHEDVALARSTADTGRPILRNSYSR